MLTELSSQVPIASILVLLALIAVAGVVAQIFVFLGLIVPLQIFGATSSSAPLLTTFAAGSVLVGGVSVLGFLLEACVFINPIGGFARANLFTGIVL